MLSSHWGLMTDLVSLPLFSVLKCVSIWCHGTAGPLRSGRNNDRSLWLFSPVQPLTVTAPSLTIAENMADLIDGYCRLVHGATQSFIIRPQKGEPPPAHPPPRRRQAHLQPEPFPQGTLNMKSKQVVQPSIFLLFQGSDSAHSLRTGFGQSLSTHGLCSDPFDLSNSLNMLSRLPLVFFK